MTPAPAEVALRETLPPPARLALAYAPAHTRPIWLGVLALDARLAQVVRDAREPLIGQIRLAWWRERLGEPATVWPAGEPLLDLLRGWIGGHDRLVAAVDGWEALLGEAPLAPDVLRGAAEGRAEALVAAACELGREQEAAAVRRMARGWAAADLADHVTHPEERGALVELRAAVSGRMPRLPRALRPLAVLHATAGRTGPRALLWAVRLGILGR